MNAEQGFVQVGDGLGMAFEVSGEGRAAVFIHGLMGSARTWDGVAKHLAGKNFQIIVPELMGFGRSGRVYEIERLWAKAQAQAVLKVMDSLSIEKAILVGHDFGGPTAVWMHRLAPGRLSSLLVACSNLTNDTPIPFPINMVTWPVLGAVISKLVFSRFALAMSIGKAVGGGIKLPVNEYLGDSSQLQAIQTIFGVALRELSDRYTPIMEELAEIKVPCTVLWGDKDPFFRPEQGAITASLIPGSTLKTLVGCGHFAPEERPEAVASLILELAEKS